MNEYPANPNDRILVTGGAGFIGRVVVANLLKRGFRNILCLTRPSPRPPTPDELFGADIDTTGVELYRGNLMSRDDCTRIVAKAKVVIHLAAGRGEKSFPDAYLNSVVTTRNLLDACVLENSIRRFVNISSFAVYSNNHNPHGRLLDEEASMDPQPATRGQAYCYAKVRQDELVIDYGKRHHLPYIILRPGVVYGSGNEGIHSRIGLGTFGIFLHCGGGNTIPLSFVDNCAEAIVLASITSGSDGQIFNVVDDDLPTSRSFLRQYKRNVQSFPTILVPHFLSYIACLLWEKYSSWSHQQLPPVFNRSSWRANWKPTKYTNSKLKKYLAWRQQVPTAEGMSRFFTSCRNKKLHA